MYMYTGAVCNYIFGECLISAAAPPAAQCVLRVSGRWQWGVGCHWSRGGGGGGLPHPLAPIRVAGISHTFVLPEQRSRQRGFLPTTVGGWGWGCRHRECHVILSHIVVCHEDLKGSSRHRANRLNAVPGMNVMPICVLFIVPTLM